MGDIAEMMLDGTLCEGCGVYLGAKLDLAALCDSCGFARHRDGHEVRRVGRFLVDFGPTLVPRARKIACPKCKRLVKPIGLPDHVRAVHTAA